MFFGREKSDFNVIHISAIMMATNDPELITRHKKMSAQQSMTFFSPVGPFTRIFQKKKAFNARGPHGIFLFSFSSLSRLVRDDGIDTSTNGQGR
jgi:hypothetical protein